MSSQKENKKIIYDTLATLAAGMDQALLDVLYVHEGAGPSCV